VKLAWKILIGLGALLVLLSFRMDTTVESGGGRVYNLGLQQERQTTLILGCFLFMAGIILYAVKKVKQSPDQEAEEKAAADAAKDKVKQEVKAWGTEVSQAGRDLEDIWASTLGKVRRIHVVALGTVVIGLTLLYAPVTVVDYGLGTRLEIPMRLPIWAKEPLRVGRLIFELVIEAVVIGFLYKNARK
jgi:hypothetical protein